MRENVVREILTTERNYKSCLSALIDEYQQPLKDAIAQNPDVLLSTHLLRCVCRVVSCVSCACSHLTTHVETPHVQDWDISPEQIKTLFCQVEVVMSFTTVLLNKVRSQRTEETHFSCIVPTLTRHPPSIHPFSFIRSWKRGSTIGMHSPRRSEISSWRWCVSLRILSHVCAVSCVCCWRVHCRRS